MHLGMRRRVVQVHHQTTSCGLALELTLKHMRKVTGNPMYKTMRAPRMTRQRTISPMKQQKGKVCHHKVCQQEDKID